MTHETYYAAIYPDLVPYWNSFSSTCIAVTVLAGRKTAKHV